MLSPASNWDGGTGQSLEQQSPARCGSLPAGLEQQGMAFWCGAEPAWFSMAMGAMPQQCRNVPA